MENSHSNKTALNNTAINKTTEKKSSPFSADTCNSVDEQKQRIRSGRPEGSDGGGTNTLFGKDEDKTPYQYRKAEELHRALISKRKIFHRVSIQNWAEEFRKFLNTSSVTRKEFDETLSWYIEHIGEEFIPQAFAAESFVVKFVKIREQMLQSQPSKKLNGGIRADGSIDQDFVNRILERRAALGKP